MASKNKSVTLAKNGRKVTLTIPRDIVEYKAAGWREPGTGQAQQPVPVADSAQAQQPVPVADSVEDVTAKTADSASKGGAKK